MSAVNFESSDGCIEYLLEVGGLEASATDILSFCTLLEKLTAEVKFNDDLSLVSTYVATDHYDKDGSEELFTKMYCLLIVNL